MTRITLARGRGRAGLLAAAAGIAAISLTLVGCSNGGSGGGETTAPTDEPAAGGSDLFDQSLQDLLPDAIKSAGVISFGGLWETPPTLSVDPADPTKPAGIAPDIAVLFGEILGVDVEWQNLQWPAQLPGLQAGSVDVLFGQVSVTAEREQSVVDLIPYAVRSQSLLVAAGNPHDIEGIGSLCGLTIAVPIGSTQSERVTAISQSACEAAGKPAIILSEYQGGAAAIQALRAGTVDAWMDTTPNIEATTASDTATFAAVRVPESEIPTEYSGIAISKDNPGLTEAIAGALKILVEKDLYEPIWKAYDTTSALTLQDIAINPLTGTPVGEMAKS